MSANDHLTAGDRGVILARTFRNPWPRCFNPLSREGAKVAKEKAGAARIRVFAPSREPKVVASGVYDPDRYQQTLLVNAATPCPGFVFAFVAVRVVRAPELRSFTRRAIANRAGPLPRSPHERSIPARSAYRSCGQDRTRLHRFKTHAAGRDCRRAARPRGARAAAARGGAADQGADGRRDGGHGGFHREGSRRTCDATDGKASLGNS